MDCACDSPRIVKPLDLIRAAGITPRKNTVQTVGDEPLIVDLLPPAQTNVNSHWIVEHLCATVLITTRPPQNGTPVNGLFLCPPGTPAAETLALAQGAPGLVLAARPLVLPVSERGIPYETLPNGQYVLNVTMQPGFKATVPGNGAWFLRFILNCVPGTATPGPGAGSIATLLGTIYTEPNP